MKKIESFGIIIFIIECALIFSHQAFKIHLREECHKNANHVCKRPENCSTLTRNFVGNPMICSPIGNKPAVCCPPKAIKVQSEKSFDSFPKSKFAHSADEMCHVYSDMALKVAEKTGLGCFAISKIFGGTYAESMEFPHMALLGSGENRSEHSIFWHCGGSLISDRWILTAAHCVAQRNPEETLWVRLGSLEKNKDDVNTQKFKIENIVIHPNYTSDEFYDDIALLRTEVIVKFTPYVRPICVNANNSFDFESGSVSGWGRTAGDLDGELSDNLLKVDVEKIPYDLCKKLYPRNSDFNYGILEDKMVCAGDLLRGNDTCAGDSGGPLQVRHDKFPCMFTEIGITSFGSSCDSHKGGVYTRVSKYVKWIEQIVWPKN